MKTCSKCGEEYPATVEYFPPRKNRKNNFHSWCRKCNRLRYKIYNKSEAGKLRGKRHDQTNEKRKCYIKQRNKQYRGTINGYLHEVFNSMKRRCENPTCWNYKDYGGRGIRNLFNSVNEFVDYIINILKIDPRGLQIDRINNDGNYEKGNIRFVTAKENCNNRRNSI